MLMLVISLICLGIFFISIAKNNDTTMPTALIGLVGAILFLICIKA